MVCLRREKRKHGNEYKAVLRTASRRSVRIREGRNRGGRNDRGIGVVFWKWPMCHAYLGAVGRAMSPRPSVVPGRRLLRPVVPPPPAHSHG